MKKSGWFVGVGVALTLVLTACQTPGAAESGLLRSDYDHHVKPQDDLFQFANGGWLRSTKIPSDRTKYGAFDILTDRAQADLKRIIAKSQAQDGKVGSEDQKIGDFYASFMDTKRRDGLGAKPLTDGFGRIDQISSASGLAQYFGETAVTAGSSPIQLSVDQDAKDAARYIPQIAQGGITLPDRQYYLGSDPKFAAARDQLRGYIDRTLGLAGVSADRASERIFAIENRLAQAQWDEAQTRDILASYNKFTPGQANAKTPGLDWNSYLSAAGVHADSFIVGQPSFFTALGSVVTSVPLDDWKLYLKFRLVDDYAPLLSQPFVTANFEFHSRDLGGQEKIRPAWERGVSVVDGALGDLLGKRYVKQRFSPTAKRRIDRLVHELIDTYRASIDGLDWMSPATKVEAKKKLDTLAIKIGYPMTWKDYSGLKVTSTDLIGNMERSATLDHQRDLDKLGKPVDRSEWFMTPQTVNAYYNPPMNEIVFPAAILQPPFFDAKVDNAVNYGGIGAVIGHEISHGFDDQGRKYDATGNLRDWWTAEDAQRFT
ncbi:MAG TPA: M13 family metallopeptidase, partial [Mycobacteriales bacterium]|nr:M13 family metallopeptidase [Mycobacteriales bacterium]